jgi:hypothetical protein
MAALPPPEGMTEEDYDSIHAAVVETVRGRWFLSEYARRSRVDEVQDMLSAIGRLEKIVTATRAPSPPIEVSPHMRLLAQRAGEIALRLSEIAEDLRATGADPYLCDDLDAQVRAISGLPKGHSAESPPSSATHGIVQHAQVALEAPSCATLPDLTRDLWSDGPECDAADGDEALRQANLQEKPAADPAGISPTPVAPSLPQMPRATPLRIPDGGIDQRLAALAALDRLTLAEKLALFS